MAEYLVAVHQLVSGLESYSFLFSFGLRVSLNRVRAMEAGRPGRRPTKFGERVRARVGDAGGRDVGLARLRRQDRREATSAGWTGGGRDRWRAGRQRAARLGRCSAPATPGRSGSIRQQLVRVRVRAPSLPVRQFPRVPIPNPSNRMGPAPIPAPARLWAAMRSGGIPVNSARAQAPQPASDRTPTNKYGLKQDAAYFEKSTRRPV